MDYKVVLSEDFLGDLRRIIESLIERADSETAFRIGNQLLERALEIGESPFIGQIVPERPGARKVLRYRYQIYYDVNEPQQTIEVLRVWHGARNPDALRFQVNLSLPPRPSHFGFPQCERSQIRGYVRIALTTLPCTSVSR